MIDPCTVYIRPTPCGDRVTLAATAELVASAAAAGTAVLAFNVITIEHVEGVADGVGARRVGRVVPDQREHHRFPRWPDGPPGVGLRTRSPRHSSAPLAIHLDHLRDVALIAEAIEAAAGIGVSSIMVDAAHLSYRDNVEQTRAFSRDAPRRGAVGRSRAGRDRRQELERPCPRCPHRPGRGGRVRRGDRGGRPCRGGGQLPRHDHPGRPARRRTDREAAARVAVPLVLHGSSGVSDEGIRRAVDAGIRKVNVGTALNVAYTGAVRDVLSTNASASDPRGFLAAGRRAIADSVAELCRVVAVDGGGDPMSPTTSPALAGQSPHRHTRPSQGR